MSLKLWKFFRARDFTVDFYDFCELHALENEETLGEGVRGEEGGESRKGGERRHEGNAFPATVKTHLQSNTLFGRFEMSLPTG